MLMDRPVANCPVGNMAVVLSHRCENGRWGVRALNVHGHNARHVAVIVVLVSFSCPFAFPRGMCVCVGGGGGL